MIDDSDAPVSPESYKLEMLHRSLVERAPIGMEKTQILCVSCRSSTRMRAQNDTSTRTWCRAIGKYVPDTIVECSQYQRMGSLTLGEMAELALDIGGKRKVGFLREHVARNLLQGL